MSKVTAFVGRSFHASDEPKIQPILKFLDSFKKLGFLWHTAEPAEVESVSKQVRSLIEASDVFIGIFTRRHPILQASNGWRTAVNLWLRRSRIQAWTAPPWVLQESGYAIGKDRSLILLREQGVEIPGLQGDLEYVEFTSEDFTVAFRRISEMISDLMAKARGLQVETVVTAAPPPAKTPDSTTAQLGESVRQEPSFSDDFEGLTASLAKRDWGEAQSFFETGLERIRVEKPDLIMFWKIFYHRSCFEAGKPNAFEALKALAEQNPTLAAPVAAIARALSNYKEYEKAAHYFLKATELDSPEGSVRNRVAAARCYRQLKRFEDAVQILERILVREAASGESRVVALKELRDCFKDSDQKFKATALGELILDENPGDSDFRFTAAFDCQVFSHNELSMHHYKIVTSADPQNAAALNNLGIAHFEVGLPIAGISDYREALKNGNTLAASNIAYKYLESGFAEDAKGMLNEAMKQPDCVPDVSRALAAVADRREQEINKEKQAEEVAEKSRAFFVNFGRALLDQRPSNLDGVWEFPWVELPLTSSGDKIAGSTTVKSESALVGLRTLLGGPSEPDKTVTTYEFSGSFSGRTCEFLLETERRGDLLLGGDKNRSRRGYIIFSVDGHHGQLAEVKDGKPSEFHEVTKQG